MNVLINTHRTAWKNRSDTEVAANLIPTVSSSIRSKYPAANIKYFCHEMNIDSDPIWVPDSIRNTAAAEIQKECAVISREHINKKTPLTENVEKTFNELQQAAIAHRSAEELKKAPDGKPSVPVEKTPEEPTQQNSGPIQFEIPSSVGHAVDGVSHFIGNL